MNSDRYFINEEKTVFIRISMNVTIESIPMDSWYISDWRVKEENWEERKTVPGYFGKQLLNYLKQIHLNEIEDPIVLAYFMLMVAGKK